jgi:hypothetical protein
MQVRLPFELVKGTVSCHQRCLLADPRVAVCLRNLLLRNMLMTHIKAAGSKRRRG